MSVYRRFLKRKLKLKVIIMCRSLQRALYYPFYRFFRYHFGNFITIYDENFICNTEISALFIFNYYETKITNKNNAKMNYFINYFLNN